jgi:hypothetical protein
MKGCEPSLLALVSDEPPGIAAPIALGEKLSLPEQISFTVYLYI